MAGAPTWSTLLEALHSALIDALIRLSPDHQLLLGLPKKTADATAPDPLCTRTWRTGAELADLGRCVILLAASPELAQDHGIELAALWKQLLTEARATSFPQKALNPSFLDSPGPSPRQVIWIPVGLQRASILLGLGI